MIDLLADPESIHFLQGKSISLPLLKNEIDRRLLRITCMVKKMGRKKRRSLEQKHNPNVEHKHIQTEHYEDDRKWANVSSGALATIDCSQSINRQMSSPVLMVENEIKERKSNPKSNRQSNAKEPTERKAHNQQGSNKGPAKEPQHPLIQSNGFTFREVQGDHSGSTDRKVIQASQDDKFFDNLDLHHQISNVEMCNSVTPQAETRCMTVAVIKEPSKNELLMVSSFTDLSGSELGRTQVSGRRANKRFKFSGREVTLPQPEKRIIVSETCLQRMEKEVQGLYHKKRKQVCDYKLRINVLKKIEDKYGEDYGQ